MNWILVIVLSTGAVDTTWFATEHECREQMAGIVMATLPALQSGLSNEQLAYANSIVAIDCMKRLGTE